MRTLKDLMDYDKDKELRNRIRQEAIKRIKAHWKRWDRRTPSEKVNFIIEFFNLTEEDLKWNNYKHTKIEY